VNALVGVNTPKLTVPSEFKPTRSDRGWLIPFYSGDNPLWTIFAAIVPAIIATLLVFMDQQITAVIINKKEFKLKKGLGYHLDLFIVAITICICSILGLPWFVAATVLALTHVNALKVMSENSAPGEKAIFLGVREQRVTCLLMSIFIGLSVFITKILSYIPMPVLYAVFLHMGVSTLSGLQFFDRLLLVFMPAKHQPDYSYLKYVKINRVHLYTFFQILSLGAMWLVKKLDAIAIGFPLLVVFTCVVRKLLDYVFTKHELIWLDQLLPSEKKPYSDLCLG
jgi:solute carrier family 4 (sodium bicarbonate transporter), member 10